MVETTKGVAVRLVAWACLIHASKIGDDELVQRVARQLESIYRFVPPLPSRQAKLSPADPVPPTGSAGEIDLEHSPTPANSWSSVVRVHAAPSDGKTRLGCHDLFLARVDSSPVFLLVDGSAGRGIGHENDTRRRLFRALSSVWLWIDTEPAVVFDILAKILFAANKIRQGKVYCSAVLAVPRPATGRWVVAEVGDTKAFRVADLGDPAIPIWSEGLPTGDHRLVGSLGTNRPEIRVGEVNVPDGGSLMLLTDGAYHLLNAHKLVLPDGSIPLSAADRFPELLATSSLTDDATLVRLSPPEGVWPIVQ
jgi:hypothetical protein